MKLPGFFKSSYCLGFQFKLCFAFVLSSVFVSVFRGVARICQRGRGGGGHNVSNIIVMAFSRRNIVGCFLKKLRLAKGGSRAPQDPPSLRPWFYNYGLKWTRVFRLVIFFVKNCRIRILVRSIILSSLFLAAQELPLPVLWPARIVLGHLRSATKV